MDGFIFVWKEVRVAFNGDCILLLEEWMVG